MSFPKKTALYLKNTAMLAYNDAFIDYIDLMIKEEENKDEYNKDIEKIEQLNIQKERYYEELELTKQAEQHREFNVQEIFKKTKELKALENIGQKLEQNLGKNNHMSFS